jgi:hypothetical protein
LEVSKQHKPNTISAIQFFDQRGLPSSPSLLTSPSQRSNTTAQRRVGDSVQTAYGKGQIIAIRDDGVVVVSPSHWVLANGKLPVFYLNAKDPSLAPPESPSQQPTDTVPVPVIQESTVLPRIKRAIELKDQGTEFVKKNDYENAASAYGQALTVMNVSLFPRLRLDLSLSPYLSLSPCLSLS